MTYLRKRNSKLCGLRICPLFATLRGLLRPSTLTGLLLFLSASLHTHAETLDYRVEWRLIQAGVAKITTTSTATGADTKLEMQSLGMVSRLFKVNDVYSVNLKSDLCAQTAHMMAEESSRKKETWITFNAPGTKTLFLEKDLIKNTTVQQEIPVPACVHDVVGGLLKMRTLKMAPGTVTSLPITNGKKFAEVRLEIQEREEVKTPAGTFKTMRMEAFLFNGVLYARAARCLIWVTDDEKRTPVQIQIRMRFHIGTVTLLLEKEGK